MTEGFKVSVIGGAGTVGAMTCYNIAVRGFAQKIVCVDIREEKAVGEVHDVNHGIAYDSHTQVEVGGYTDVKGSDAVVITAGASTNDPTRTRLDLADDNKPLIESIVEKIDRHAPDAVVLLVTNPVDVFNHYIDHLSDRPREKTIGFAGILDSARFRYVLSEEFDTPVTNIEASVVGEHGDTQVPLFSKANVDGRKIAVSDQKKEEITRKVRRSAPEIVEKKDATQFGPSRGAAYMVETVARNNCEIIPSSVVLEGEYGHENVSVGVPVKIGREGVEEIVEWGLSEREQDMFDESAEKIKKHQYV